MLYNKRQTFSFMLTRPINDVDLSELADSLAMMYANQLLSAGHSGQSCCYRRSVRAIINGRFSIRLFLPWTLLLISQKLRILIFGTDAEYPWQTLWKLNLKFLRITTNEPTNQQTNSCQSCDAENYVKPSRSYHRTPSIEPGVTLGIKIIDVVLIKLHLSINALVQY